MREILMRSVMTGSGEQTFKGLYNENGFPVQLVFRKDDDTAVLSVIYDDGDKVRNRNDYDCGISEEEIDRVCAEHDDCSSCPLNDLCGEGFDEEEDEDEDCINCPDRTECKEMRCQTV